MSLEAKNLSQSFYQGGREIKALNNVSLSLPQGETLAVVGPSGSGKTTLLSLLAGLEPLQKGELTYKDESVHRMDEQQRTNFRARHLGIVFQQFHLMPHLTAAENVSLPLDLKGESQAHARALAVLNDVGLADRADHLPHQLSGGECQRVALARALVTKPQLILADEPSGNLDTETGQQVMDLLFKTIKDHGVSLVLVTHDNDLAQRCQHQVHLVGGQRQ